MDSYCINTFLQSGAIISIDCSTVLVGWGHCTKFPSMQNDSAFYFPNYFLRDEHPWVHYPNNKTLTIQYLIENTQTEKQLIDWEVLPKEHFYRGYHSLQSLIERKHMKKGVPYIIQKGKSTLDLSSLLHHALLYAQKSGGYLYGFWNSSEGIIGVTPELLFQKDDLSLSTVACAGSGKCAQSIRSQKELQEHQIVIDGIQESLHNFGNVDVHKTTVKHLPTIKHLFTPISVKLRPHIQFKDLVDALHPTPALGTYPKQNGLNWLQEQESIQPRGRYGAPVGCIHSGKEFCYVGIRNIQWIHNIIKMGVGCGVIADSTIEKEWDEIQLKIQSIKEILGLL